MSTCTLEQRRSGGQGRIPPRGANSAEIVPATTCFAALADGNGDDDGGLVEGIAADGDPQLPLSGNGHRDRPANVTPRAVLTNRNRQRPEVAGGQQEGRLDLLGRVRPARAASARYPDLVRPENRGRHRDADIATSTGTAGVERGGRADRLGEGFPRGGGIDQDCGNREPRRNDHRLRGD